VAPELPVRQGHHVNLLLANPAGLLDLVLDHYVKTVRRVSRPLHVIALA
jgi:hypothetical protein